MIITLDQIVAAGVSREVAALWLQPIRDACREFGIDTPRRAAAFIAQCAHESAGFTRLSENLNYSAEGMAGVWPTRFAERGSDGKYKKDAKGRNVPNALARLLHRKPEQIANTVYANRMGNGPITSGDGWRHRGMGPKQLTGKDNHRACGTALGVDLVSNPELLLEPRTGIRAAAWFWKTNNCNLFADREDHQGLTRRINGGLIGFEDRRKRTVAALQSFAVTA